MDNLRRFRLPRITRADSGFNRSVEMQFGDSPRRILLLPVISLSF
jgi:hypothetical protein